MQSDVEARLRWLEIELERLRRIIVKLEELNGVNNQNAMLRSGNPLASS